MLVAPLFASHVDKQTARKACVDMTEEEEFLSSYLSMFYLIEMLIIKTEIKRMEILRIIIRSTSNNLNRPAQFIVIP